MMLAIQVGHADKIGVWEQRMQKFDALALTII